MIVDVNIKHCYEKYLKDANNDKAKYEDNLNKVINILNIAKSYIEKHNFILIKIGINLDKYKEEWIDEKYNENKTLRNIAFDKLKFYNSGNERIVLIQVIKYCNLLNIINNTKRQIKLCDERSKLKFGKYREIVKKYYAYGVHKCCLEGYAYVFRGGLGRIMINRWKVSETAPKKIDHRATNIAREKLIAEGKVPYNEEQAKIAKLRGFKYNGVKYVVYKSNSHYYEFTIDRIKRLRKELTSFKQADTYKLRGKSHEEVAAECKCIDDIYKLNCDVVAKLSILLKFDPSNYINFVRNVSENKLESGAHTIKRMNRYGIE